MEDLMKLLSAELKKRAITVSKVANTPANIGKTPLLLLAEVFKAVELREAKFFSQLLGNRSRVTSYFGRVLDIIASGTVSMKLDSSSWHKEQLTKLAQELTSEERSTMMYLLEDHIQAVGGFTEGEVAWLRQTFS